MTPWRAAPVRLQAKSVEKLFSVAPPPPPSPPPPPPTPPTKITSPVSQLTRLLPPPPAPRQVRPPPPGVQGFAGSFSMLLKKNYHTTSASPLGSLSPRKMTHLLPMQRGMASKSTAMASKITFYGVKENFAARVQNFSAWLKRVLTQLLVTLKASLIEYFQYLKKGFEDRALSLVFNAHLLAGYVGLCWGIESMQSTLSQVESDAKGGVSEDDLAQSLRKAALRLLLVLKKVLMFWSNEDVKQEVRYQAALGKKLVDMVDEVADETVKLSKELKELKARMDVVEEAMKRDNADAEQAE